MRAIVIEVVRDLRSKLLELESLGTRVGARDLTRPELARTHHLTARTV